MVFVEDVQMSIKESHFPAEHQSIYIGVPVSRGYRRKHRRRRSNRETQDPDRRYNQPRHHDQYGEIDMEEGLIDSAEQSLQDINRTSKLEATKIKY